MAKITTLSIFQLQRQHTKTTSDVLIRDDELKGFGIKITPRGLVSFFAEGRVKGQDKTRRIVIGRYPALNAVDARLAAAETLARMREGIDPVASRSRPGTGEDISFRALVETALAQKTLSPKTRYDYETSLHRFFEQWMELPVAAITSDLIYSRYLELTAPENEHCLAPGSALKTMRILSSLFRTASPGKRRGNRDALPNHNPVQPVLKLIAQPADDKPGKLTLQQVRLISEFTGTLEPHDRTILADWLTLSLVCGIGRTACLGILWRDIDFENGWIMQQQARKRVSITPLPASLLKRLGERNPEYRWLFPRENDNTRSMQSPPRQLNMLKKPLNLEFTQRDLVHIHQQACYELGFSRQQIAPVYSQHQWQTAKPHLVKRSRHLSLPMNEIAEFLFGQTHLNSR